MLYVVLTRAGIVLGRYPVDDGVPGRETVLPLESGTHEHGII